MNNKKKMANSLIMEREKGRRGGREEFNYLHFSNVIKANNWKKWLSKVGAKLLPKDNN